VFGEAEGLWTADEFFGEEGDGAVAVFAEDDGAVGKFLASDEIGGVAVACEAESEFERAEEEGEGERGEEGGEEEFAGEGEGAWGGVEG